MLIPEKLVGTATEKLLKEIERAASARNLFVKREWSQRRWDSAAIYTVLRGDAPVLPPIELKGGEGKTPRSGTYGQLEELLKEIEALPIPSADELPSIPCPGTYVLRDADRTALHGLGAQWRKAQPGHMIVGSGAAPACYWAPERTLEQVRSLLESRRGVVLGRLSYEQRALVEQLVPLADRRFEGGIYPNAESIWSVLARHEQVVREAFAGEQWVNLGSAFPRSANDPLRALGGRWNGSGWSIRKRSQSEAQAIIAAAREADLAEREAQIERKAEEMAAQRAAGIIGWQEGEGYGGGHIEPGTLVYRSAERDGEKRWYVVTSCKSTYYREDGMSFGVGDEQGRVYYYIARPATEEESAEREAQRLHQAEQQRLRRVVEDGIREHFQWDSPGAEYPWGEDGKSLIPEGEQVDVISQNLYGGGNWFVVEPDVLAIWHITNNGMDGDDWSRNNVGTGGAGAIGLRFPATPERLEIVDAARKLERKGA